MKRTLSALRIELTPPPGKRGLWEFIANRESPEDPAVRPPEGKRWMEVIVGDVCRDRDGHERTVLRVRIFRAYGEQDGDVIVCGRDWVATGNVISLERP